MRRCQRIRLSAEEDVRLPGLPGLLTIVALAAMFMDPSAVAWADATAAASFCPPGTYLDNVSCVRARATCGGWDGTSCGSGDPARRPAPPGNLAWAFAESSSICSADASYSGFVRDVLKAVDRLSYRAEVLRRAVDRDVARDVPPGVRVAALAAVGAAYDCIWTGLRESKPVLFTPQQQALLARLQQVQQQLQPGSPAPSAQASSTQQQVRAEWLVAEDERLAVLERPMLRYYVASALLARRYALEGFGLTRAAERLPMVAAILGEERMARELSEMDDPTDPEPDAQRRRHLKYSPASFRNAVSW
jgi:hypothetical protein